MIKMDKEVVEQSASELHHGLFKYSKILFDHENVLNAFQHARNFFLAFIQQQSSIVFVKNEHIFSKMFDRHISYFY